MSEPYDHEAIAHTLFPPVAGATLPVTESMRPVDLALGDGTYVGGYWSGPLDQAPVLYALLGAGEVVADQVERWPLWAREAGANLFLLDYPGQGSSDGVPTLSACREAARAGLDYLLTRPREEVPAIVVLGRSVGSLFAVDVAHRHLDRVDGLILESGIASPEEWLEPRIPWEASGLDREAVLAKFARDFDPQARLSALTVPVLVLQAAFASEVPVASGEALSSWGCGTMTLFKRGEHGNVPVLNEADYRAALVQFMDELLHRDELE